MWSILVVVLLSHAVMEVVTVKADTVSSPLVSGVVVVTEKTDCG